MRHSPSISYDLVLVITEVFAVLLAVWLMWAAQTPSLV